MASTVRIVVQKVWKKFDPCSRLQTMCIMRTRRPTKRASGEDWTEYKGTAQPLKSRYWVLSSYGPAAGLSIF